MATTDPVGRSRWDSRDNTTTVRVELLSAPDCPNVATHEIGTIHALWVADGGAELLQNVGRNLPLIGTDEEPFLPRPTAVRYHQVVNTGSGRRRPLHDIRVPRGRILRQVKPADLTHLTEKVRTATQIKSARSLSWLDHPATPIHDPGS